MDYAPLIRFVAQRIAARLPSNIDIDDLISAGVIGLMDAIEKYDPSRDNKFKTYAEFRIRGAILDELRSQDWVPRSVRDKAKKIEKTYAELEQKLGRAVSDQEVSNALGVNLEEYYEMVAKVKAVTLLSIDELSGPNQQDKKSLLECLENVSSKNPFTQLKSKGVRDLLLRILRIFQKNKSWFYRFTITKISILRKLVRSLKLQNRELVSCIRKLWKN